MTDRLADLKSHIGNRETRHDAVTASQVGRLAAALGVDHPAPAMGDPIPPGWHAVFFPSLAPLDKLRPDGQPSGGGVTPPVPLPRRRIVAVRGTFHDGIRVGDEITQETELTALSVEDRGAGPVVSMTTTDRISTPRGLAAVDERDFLMFGEDGPGGAVAHPNVPTRAAWRREYASDPVMIFRLSAVRFNGHRIHYDRDYAVEVEGYAGLVVPVTLVTFLMMEMCRAEVPDRPLASFAYRSIKPVCDLGPYRLFGAPQGDHTVLWARDYANELSVTAEARFTA